MYEKTLREFNIDPSLKDDWLLFHDRQCSNPVANSRSTLASSSIKHGDMIFLTQIKNDMDDDVTMQMNEDASNDRMAMTGEEDDVDVELAKQNGQIIRAKDEQL